MTREEVKALVGKPDDVEKLPGFEEEVNDELESWHYDEHEFSLVFDSDFEWRLVSIAISDPFFTFNGTSLVGMEKQDLLDYFGKLGIIISATEDLSDEENPGLELIESEESGMMVWFVDDEVIEVQILPDVEEDGETLIWPS
jgi:hypothetical protein